MVQHMAAETTRWILLSPNVTHVVRAGRPRPPVMWHYQVPAAASFTGWNFGRDRTCSVSSSRHPSHVAFENLEEESVVAFIDVLNVP